MQYLSATEKEDINFYISYFPLLYNSSCLLMLSKAWMVFNIIKWHLGFPVILLIFRYLHWVYGVTDKAHIGIHCLHQGSFGSRLNQGKLLWTSSLVKQQQQQQQQLNEFFIQLEVSSDDEFDFDNGEAPQLDLLSDCSANGGVFCVFCSWVRETESGAYFSPTRWQHRSQATTSRWSCSGRAASGRPPASSDTWRTSSMTNTLRHYRLEPPSILRSGN